MPNDVSRGAEDSKMVHLARLVTEHLLQIIINFFLDYFNLSAVQY